jgi:hypothetical protein
MTITPRGWAVILITAFLIGALAPWHLLPWAPADAQENVGYRVGYDVGRAVQVVEPAVTGETIGKSVRDLLRP